MSARTKRNRTKPKRNIHQPVYSWIKPSQTDIDVEIDEKKKMYHDRTYRNKDRFPITKRPTTDMKWAVSYESPTYLRRNTSARTARLMDTPCETDAQLKEMLDRKVLNQVAYEMLKPYCFTSDYLDEIAQYLQVRRRDQKTNVDFSDFLKTNPPRFIDRVQHASRDKHQQRRTPCPSQDLVRNMLDINLIDSNTYAFLQSSCFPLATVERYSEMIETQFRQELHRFLLRNDTSDFKGTFRYDVWKPFTRDHAEAYMKNEARAENHELRFVPKTYPLRNKPIVPQTGQYYLPVVRYANIYFETDRDFNLNTKEMQEKPKRGTFFYVDPNSPILLHLGNTRVFATKYHAFRVLIEEYASKHQRTYGRALFHLLYGVGGLEPVPVMAYPSISLEQTIDMIWRVARAQAAEYPKTNPPAPIPVVSPDVLSATIVKKPKPRETMMLQYYLTLANGDEQFDDPKFDVSVNWHVLAPCLGDRENTEAFHIGSSDWLDQPLLVLMKALQLDTIVLQHEEGSLRSVTEILDSRPNPYQNNLFRTVQSPGYLLRDQKNNNNNQRDEWYTPSFPYCATIWCPLNGMLTPSKNGNGGRHRRSHRLFIGKEQFWDRVSMIVDLITGQITPVSSIVSNQGKRKLPTNSNQNPSFLKKQKTDSNEAEPSVPRQALAKSKSQQEKEEDEIAKSMRMTNAYENDMQRIKALERSYLLMNADSDPAHEIQIPPPQPQASQPPP